VPQTDPAAAVAGVGRVFILACVLALLLGACGVVSTSPPAATPADFVGITSELAKRGVGVNHFVSGDAGCSDSVLTPTAIAFDAKGLDQAANVRIYLYIFRNREVFERLRSSVDACAASFVTDPETFETVEESPYVLAGQGPWGADFEAALRAALAVAAGSGG
jgi:hypothetical protein